MYPKEVISQAKRTGYYRSMKTGALWTGQKWVEDQMTGEGHVEGKLDISGGIIGYMARIEMWNGYTASMYMTVEEVENARKKTHPEDLVLSRLITTGALQAYQGEIKNEPEPISND